MMKIQPVLLVLFLNSLPLFGQVRTFYYTSFWRLTTEANSEYYRLSRFNTSSQKFTGEFQDFYSDNDAILQKGNYNQSGEKDGYFTMYHRNGSVLAEGQYKNDKLYGDWTFYYENGSIDKIVDFNKSPFIIKENYTSGGERVVSNGTGYWKEDLIFGQINGEFLDGKRNGEWTLKLPDGTTMLQEEYRKGRLRGSSNPQFTEIIFQHIVPNHLIESLAGHDVTVEQYPLIQSLPQASFNSLEDRAFTIVEEEPHYLYGDFAFRNLIASNLVYPQEAFALKIQGRVYVSFVVNQDGTLSEVSAIKGIGYGCDEEAVRLISLAEPWIPAYQQKAPVKFRFVLPVEFRLSK